MGLKIIKGLYSQTKGAVMRFLGNNCSMHAAGLTYFALLAIVPVLCCVLVAAKTAGIDKYAKAQINSRIDVIISEIERGQDDELVKLTPQSEEELEKKRIAAKEFANQARRISNTLFERIDHFDVGTLGWIGFGFLLWTLISTLASVETSFNEIFNVEKARPIWKRSYMYLFIMVVLPIMATLAMSLPILSVVKDVILMTLGATWLTKWVGDGIIMLLDSWVFKAVFSMGIASIAFGFFFWVMPNCRIGVWSAWIGGVITAVLFGGWMKICAIAQVGIAKSSAMYGSFAFLPIVLAWLYMSWQIVLFGACIVKGLEAETEKDR